MQYALVTVEHVGQEIQPNLTVTAAKIIKAVINVSNQIALKRVAWKFHIMHRNEL